MAKVFRSSESVGYQIEAIDYEGQQYISIRKVYKTKKEPDVWKMGYQGVTIPVAGVQKITGYMQKLVDDEETEYKHIAPKVKEPSAKGKK